MGYFKYLTAKGIKALFYSAIVYTGPTTAIATLGPVPFIAVATFIQMGGIEFVLMAF